MQCQTLDRLRLIKWELKVGNEPDMKLEEDTLRNRSGPEVEDRRAGMENVRAKIRMGTDGVSAVGEMED